MPNYIDKAIQRFQHPPPTHPVDSLQRAQPLVYGPQTALPEDSTQTLSKPDTKQVQQILGVLLYYARQFTVAEVVEPLTKFYPVLILRNLTQSFDTLSKNNLLNSRERSSQ